MKGVKKSKKYQRKERTEERSKEVKMDETGRSDSMAVV
jgi:hypothetical protein